MVLSSKQIEERVRFLKRGIEEMISPEELAAKIEDADKQSRSLVVKMGVDPTAPDIHLGHTVPLMKMKQFQDLGYEVTFLIGDFTTRIGDPSGRNAARPALTEQQILANASVYKQQVFKILNPDKTKIVYNSEWLSPISLNDFIKLLGKGTVNDQIKRRGVAMRLEEGSPVSVAEFVYPFLQAYDSVALKADIELGGGDQLYNLIFGREIQKEFGQQPQVVITMPILTGIDGKEKMSKSYGNYVSLNDSPKDMYGKIMSVPDGIILDYFRLLTTVPLEEIYEIEDNMTSQKVNPRDIKSRLAKELVSMYHSKGLAEIAEKQFDAMFRDHEIPKDIQTYTAQKGKKPLASLLVESGLAPSNSEARRLITQGGVKIDNTQITDPFYETEGITDSIIKVGKRNYRRIVIEE